LVPARAKRIAGRAASGNQRDLAGQAGILLGSLHVVFSLLVMNDSNAVAAREELKARGWPARVLPCGGILGSGV
jgi:hypothetical protein